MSLPFKWKIHLKSNTCKQKTGPSHIIQGGTFRAGAHFSNGVVRYNLFKWPYIFKFHWGEQFHPNFSRPVINLYHFFHDLNASKRGGAYLYVQTHTPQGSPNISDARVSSPTLEAVKFVTNSSRWSKVYPPRESR